jgi:AraC family transcriptional regulator
MVSLSQPRFQHAGAMRIAGLSSHFTSASLDDIPALWRRLVSLGKVAGRVGPVDYAVVILLHDGCNYLAGCEVSESAALPEGLTCTELPPNEYVVFSHNGHVSTLRNTFDSALRNWLPASEFSIARTARDEPYALERYGERFDPVTGTGDIEVWIPVSRRSG